MGFQNASGGHLLIGVNDGGEILGIQHVDEFKNKDTYSQRVEQHIGKCLGQISLSKVVIKFVDVDKKLICHIEVKSYFQHFVWIDPTTKTKKSEEESIFYLRQNNMTVL